MIAVTSLDFSQRSSRRSSARMMRSLVKPPKSVSTVSSTTRLALIESKAYPSRMNSPSRSYSPVSSISLHSICTWSITSFFRSTSSFRFQPSEATFFVSSYALSSNAIKPPALCTEARHARETPCQRASCRSPRHRRPRLDVPLVIPPSNFVKALYACWRFRK
jgi:hypothetical protein